MSYLLDTCVVSELVSRRPDAKVARWFDQSPEDRMYISCLTLGELIFGIGLLPDGKKKNDLAAWYDEFTESFRDSTFPITNTVCIRWGIERARLRKSGIQLPVIDGLIACSAIEYDCTLVTRNTADFGQMDVRLYNPWL